MRSVVRSWEREVRSDWAVATVACWLLMLEVTVPIETAATALAAADAELATPSAAAD
jgi:hypothetical protein